MPTLGDAKLGDKVRFPDLISNPREHSNLYYPSSDIFTVLGLELEGRSKGYVFIGTDNGWSTFTPSDRPCEIVSNGENEMPTPISGLQAASTQWISSIGDAGGAYGTGGAGGAGFVSAYGYGAGGAGGSVAVPITLAPGITDEQLEQLKKVVSASANDGFQHQSLLGLASKTKDARILDVLSRSSSASVREAVGYNKHITAETCELLLKDAYRGVRMAVAGSDTTTQETLLKSLLPPAKPAVEPTPKTEAIAVAPTPIAEEPAVIETIEPIEVKDTDSGSFWGALALMGGAGLANGVIDAMLKSQSTVRVAGETDTIVMDSLGSLADKTVP